MEPDIIEYERLLLQRAEALERAEAAERHALPRTTVEAEYFLWHALWHITGGLILCRVPRRGSDAGKVIREAIERLTAWDL